MRILSENVIFRSYDAACMQITTMQRKLHTHTHTHTHVTQQVSSVSCDKDSTESVEEKVVMAVNDYTLDATINLYSSQKIPIK